MAYPSDNWIAPENVAVPHFIICGAMKSGTTTLHYILNQHPDVFIPKGEVHFFDIDNLFAHNDFDFYSDGKWFSQNMDDDRIAFWNWYASRFKGKKDHQVTGEDSTTYMASEIAAQRISMQQKKTKIIIMLRHPADRAYSQYWHMLITGRATYNFEDTILYNPYSILDRSLYYEQLKKFLSYFSSDQVKIIIFEAFLANKERVLKELCEFIGVNFSLLPVEALKAHVNAARIPKFPSLQILKNRLLPQLGNKHYASQLPNTPSIKKKDNLAITFIHKIHRAINPLIEKKPPEMKKSTRQFLDNYFKRELEGLNELIDKDVLSLWFAENKNS